MSWRHSPPSNAGPSASSATDDLQQQQSFYRGYHQERYAPVPAAARAAPYTPHTEPEVRMARGGSTAYPSQQQQQFVASSSVTEHYFRQPSQQYPQAAPDSAHQRVASYGGGPPPVSDATFARASSPHRQLPSADNRGASPQRSVAVVTAAPPPPVNNRPVSPQQRQQNLQTAPNINSAHQRVPSYGGAPPVSDATLARASSPRRQLADQSLPTGGAQPLPSSAANRGGASPQRSVVVLTAAPPPPINSRPASPRQRGSSAVGRATPPRVPASRAQQGQPQHSSAASQSLHREVSPNSAAVRVSMPPLSRAHSPPRVNNGQQQQSLPLNQYPSQQQQQVGAQQGCPRPLGSRASSSPRRAFSPPPMSRPPPSNNGSFASAGGPSPLRSPPPLGAPPTSGQRQSSAAPTWSSFAEDSQPHLHYSSHASGSYGMLPATTSAVAAANAELWSTNANASPLSVPSSNIGGGQRQAPNATGLRVVSAAESTASMPQAPRAASYEANRPLPMMVSERVAYLQGRRDARAQQQQQQQEKLQQSQEVSDQLRMVSGEKSEQLYRTSDLTEQQRSQQQQQDKTVHAYAPPQPSSAFCPRELTAREQAEALLSSLRVSSAGPAGVADGAPAQLRPHAVEDYSHRVVEGGIPAENKEEPRGHHADPHAALQSQGAASAAPPAPKDRLGNGDDVPSVATPRDSPQRLPRRAQEAAARRTADGSVVARNASPIPRRQSNVPSPDGAAASRVSSISAETSRAAGGTEGLLTRTNTNANVAHVNANTAAAGASASTGSAIQRGSTALYAQQQHHQSSAAVGRTTSLAASMATEEEYARLVHVTSVAAHAPEPSIPAHFTPVKRGANDTEANYMFCQGIGSSGVYPPQPQQAEAAQALAQSGSSPMERLEPHRPPEIFVQRSTANVLADTLAGMHSELSRAPPGGAAGGAAPHPLDGAVRYNEQQQPNGTVAVGVPPTPVNTPACGPAPPTPANTPAWGVAPPTPANTPAHRPTPYTPANTPAHGPTPYTPANTPAHGPTPYTPANTPAHGPSAPTPANTPKWGVNPPTPANTPAIGVTPHNTPALSYTTDPPGGVVPPTPANTPAWGVVPPTPANTPAWGVHPPTPVSTPTAIAPQTPANTPVAGPLLQSRGSGQQFVRNAADVVITPSNTPTAGHTTMHQQPVPPTPANTPAWGVAPPTPANTPAHGPTPYTPANTPAFGPTPQTPANTPAHGPTSTPLTPANTPAYGPSAPTPANTPAWGVAPPTPANTPAHGPTPYTPANTPAFGVQPPTPANTPTHGLTPPTPANTPAVGPTPPTPANTPAWGVHPPTPANTPTTLQPAIGNSLAVQRASVGPVAVGPPTPANTPLNMHAQLRGAPKFTDEEEAEASKAARISQWQDGVVATGGRGKGSPASPLNDTAVYGHFAAAAAAAGSSYPPTPAATPTNLMLAPPPNDHHVAANQQQHQPTHHFQQQQQQVPAQHHAMQQLHPHALLQQREMSTSASALTFEFSKPPSPTTHLQRHLETVAERQQQYMAGNRGSVSFGNISGHAPPPLVQPQPLPPSSHALAPPRHTNTSSFAPSEATPTAGSRPSHAFRTNAETGGVFIAPREGSNAVAIGVSAHANAAPLVEAASVATFTEDDESPMSQREDDERALLAARAERVGSGSGAALRVDSINTHRPAAHFGTTVGHHHQQQQQGALADSGSSRLISTSTAPVADGEREKERAAVAPLRGSGGDWRRNGSAFPPAYMHTQQQQQHQKHSGGRRRQAVSKAAIAATNALAAADAKATIGRYFAKWWRCAVLRSAARAKGSQQQQQHPLWSSPEPQRINRYEALAHQQEQLQQLQPARQGVAGGQYVPTMRSEERRIAQSEAEASMGLVREPTAPTRLPSAAPAPIAAVSQSQPRPVAAAAAPTLLGNPRRFTHPFGEAIVETGAYAHPNIPSHHGSSVAQPQQGSTHATSHSAEVGRRSDSVRIATVGPSGTAVSVDVPAAAASADPIRSARDYLATRRAQQELTAASDSYMLAHASSSLAAAAAAAHGRGHSPSSAAAEVYIPMSRTNSTLATNARQYLSSTAAAPQGFHHQLRAGSLASQSMYGHMGVGGAAAVIGGGGVERNVSPARSGSVLDVGGAVVRMSAIEAVNKTLNVGGYGSSPHRARPAAASAGGDAYVSAVARLRLGGGGEALAAASSAGEGRHFYPHGSPLNGTGRATSHDEIAVGAVGADLAEAMRGRARASAMQHLNASTVGTSFAAPFSVGGAYHRANLSAAPRASYAASAGPATPAESPIAARGVGGGNLTQYY